MYVCRVHYPIPLNHSGPPNLQVMQKNIFQLRSEVVILRNAKISLEEEVINLKQIHQHTENNDVKNYGEKGLALGLMGGAELSHKMRCRCPEEEDQVLIGELRLRIGVLEETLEETRADHLKIVEKLQAENNFLQQKLNSSGKYEERLEDEIYLLTHGSSVPPGRKSQPQIGCVTCKRKDEMKRKISLNLWNSGDNAAASRRGIKTNLANLVGRRRVGSPGISPLPIMRRSRSFSPSPSRKVSFDPTAYIREKKLKQDRMAQLRLEKIKSELQIRARDSSTSSGDGNDNKLKSRTRSISRESRGSQRSSLVVGVGGRAVSRSPLSHGRTRSSNMIINRKLENAKEISERLSRERNRSLGRRGGLVFTKNHQSPTLSSKNKMNSQIPIRSLHAHVDNLVSQELPRLRRSTRRNEIDMAE
ncbi:uncharacterized protein LOC118435052 [Folsomia candida]|uniref:uncharacterized protein LOC118435052 n=1 Tax=Folsomia candida TaxID=158441 RepID=UPI0016054DDE|nr:uncharacterized protein LOC118435052 [Folsomia candida]